MTDSSGDIGPDEIFLSPARDRVFFYKHDLQNLVDKRFTRYVRGDRLERLQALLVRCHEMFSKEGPEDPDGRSRQAERWRSRQPWRTQ